MSDRPRRSLQVILEPQKRLGTESWLLCDIVLMAALGDGLISQFEFERIARTMIGYVEFADLEWEWLMRRADELRDDGPLFSDTRAHLVENLTDPRKRRLGLSFAAKIVSSIHPLQEEELAVLNGLANAFGISDRESALLLRPWNGTAEGNKKRVYCDFNLPRQHPSPDLFDAIALSKTDDELRMLVHKLNAVRGAANKFEGAEITSIGEAIKIGPYNLRIDALVEAEDAWWPMRFLAPNEALHPLERNLFDILFARLDESVVLLIGHTGPLASADKTFLKRVKSNVRVEPIEF